VLLVSKLNNSFLLQSGQPERHWTRGLLWIKRFHFRSCPAHLIFIPCFFVFFPFSATLCFPCSTQQHPTFCVTLARSSVMEIRLGAGIEAFIAKAQVTFSLLLSVYTRIPRNKARVYLIFRFLFCSFCD
jgi:hypothetical protein